MHLQIKFSHDYAKLPAPLPFTAILLDTYIRKTEDMHPMFYSYDTTHYDYGEPQNYPLLKGKHIVLLLYAVKEKRLFTTIRRWTPQKEHYYSANTGELFDCVRTASGKDTAFLMNCTSPENASRRKKND